MHIEITVAMAYQIAIGETPLLTLEAAKTAGQTITESTLDIGSATLNRVDWKYDVGQRVWALNAGEELALRYHAKVQITRPNTPLKGLRAMPIHTLPAEALAYLRPSRFCQSDLFTDFVGQRFGHLEGGEKAAAIVAWVSGEIAYVSGSSNATTTAVDTFKARQGVCRDFAHLTCSLLRAANIPARYVSGYGIDVQPQDFHAITEAWIDGAWHQVDATGMSTPADFVVIGAGRDAADVAFLETSQWAQFIRQSVTVSRI